METVRPEEVGLSSDRLGRIDRFIEGYVEAGVISGAVAALARRGRVAYARAFGMADRTAQKPMQLDGVFRIASLTKAVTSVALMMLYEEGHFVLEDPVSEFIPEFRSPVVLTTAPDPEPARSEITIRHLLTHTSGIAYAFFAPAPLAAIYKEYGVAEAEWAGFRTMNGTVGEMVQTLAKLPLLFHPGEGWQYGLSHDVLGHVIEVLSGQSLDTFIRERIAVPLGMIDTSFYLPEAELGRAVDFYAPARDAGPDTTPQDGPEETAFMPSHEYFRGPKTYYAGGAGLASTLRDYLGMLQMLLNGGQLNGVRLLSPTTVDLMTVNSIGDLFITVDRYLYGDKMGLGFGIRTERGRLGGAESVGTYSWGGGPGHHCFWVDPEEQLVGVVLSQLVPDQPQDLLRRFRVLAYQSVVD